MTRTPGHCSALTRNVRYGLTHAGYRDASGLALVLNCSRSRARTLYSGLDRYTSREVAELAAFFGVTPADMRDEALITRAGDGAA